MKQWFQQNKRWLIILLMIVIVISGCCLLLYKPFMALVNDPHGFRNWLDQYGPFGWIIFILINMTQIILAFLPGEIIEVLAGYCYGSINGCLICMVASGIGSSIIFSLMRYFHIDLSKVFFDPSTTNKHHFLLKLEDHLSLVLFIVFLIPGTPKDILTYLMPLTKIKFTSFFMITTIARFPSIITSTMVGDALFGQDYMTSLIVYGITGILSILGLITYNRFIAKKEVRV